MDPTHDHDDDDARPAGLSTDLEGLGHDDEPTTGAPTLAPDATSSTAPTTKKRRVNDGPTGRARREATDQEGDLEADLDPGA